MKNRVYFFTGTGNSLKVAHDIKKELPDTEIVAIYKNTELDIPSGYERIGFVYPTYGWGLPNLVARFVTNTNFTKQGNAYYFAIATKFGFAGNSVKQMNELLKEKGITLNYGASIRMFGNSVVNYDMSKKIDEITKKSNKRIKPLVQNIVNKKTCSISPVNKFIYNMYVKYISNINETDYGYNVNDNCISCGICEKVCPAKNISMENGRPNFHHQCECCQACIHHCPKRAINYKDKTQNRRRYTHPQVGHSVISSYYK